MTGPLSKLRNRSPTTNWSEKRKKAGVGSGKERLKGPGSSEFGICISHHPGVTEETNGDSVYNGEL